MVASKALGRKFGIAKGATLVPVKIWLRLSNIPKAFEAIIADLDAHPGRDKEAVVVCARAYGDGWTHEKAIKQKSVMRELAPPMDDVMKRGVPFVLSSGNERKEGKPGNRPDIDTLPKVLEDKADRPIINVGSADFDGKRSSFSQGGGQLTIYAPGHGIDAMMKHDGVEDDDAGTSYCKCCRMLTTACPTVFRYARRSLICNTDWLQLHRRLLESSQPTLLWTRNRGTRLATKRLASKRLRLLDNLSRLQTRVVSQPSIMTAEFANPAHSGQRAPNQQPPVNIIWNRAKEADHKAAGANGLKPDDSKPTV
jgi:hypothetical protein